MIDLEEVGGQVLGVVGPFGSKAIVVLPVEVAQEMFPSGLAVSGMRDVVAGIERDLADIASQDARLAESGLAMTALVLGYELANPYTSATAKSMCAAKIVDALRELRALAPPVKEADAVDDIAAQREKRRAAAGGAAPETV